MHTRAWIRRGVTGVSLATPLALAPVLPVTVQAADSLATEAERMDRMVRTSPSPRPRCRAARTAPSKTAVSVVSVTRQPQTGAARP